jgi:hypothetical protein
MNTPKGNIMNRKILNYNGRNNESAIDQFSKDIQKTLLKKENKDKIEAHIRKVFHGSKPEQEQIQLKIKIKNLRFKKNKKFLKRKHFKKDCDHVMNAKIKNIQNLQSMEKADQLKIQEYQNKRNEVRKYKINYLF